MERTRHHPAIADPQPVRRPDVPDRAQRTVEHWLSIRTWALLTSALAVALILGLGGLQLIIILAHPLALLVLAISVASALAPLVARLETRLPRIAAILLVYIVVLAVLIGSASATIPTMVVQAQKLGALAPELKSMAQDRLGNLGATDLFGSLIPPLAQFSTALVSLPLSLVSSLLEIFLVLVMSIYWLVVARTLREYAISLFPPSSHDLARSVLRDIGASMGGYIRATVINVLVIGSLTAVGLAVIGVEYAFVLGVIAGLLEFLPVVGPIISGILVVVVALTQSPTLAVASLIYMFLLQQLEGNFLVPKMMQSQTEISPLLVIFAIVAGNTIGGILGALVAIPIASVLQVTFVRVVAPGVRKQVGAVEE